MSLAGSSCWPVLVVTQVRVWCWTEGPRSRGGRTRFGSGMKSKLMGRVCIHMGLAHGMRVEAVAIYDIIIVWWTTPKRNTGAALSANFLESVVDDCRADRQRAFKLPCLGQYIGQPNLLCPKSFQIVLAVLCRLWLPSTSPHACRFPHGILQITSQC